MTTNRRIQINTTSPSPCTKPHFTWQIQKFMQLDWMFLSHKYMERSTYTTFGIYSKWLVWLCISQSNVTGKRPKWHFFSLYLCSVTAITEFRNTFPSQWRQTKPSFVTVYLITLIMCSITMATASKVAHHYITSDKKDRHFKQSSQNP
jgi:hypothetical protein